MERADSPTFHVNFTRDGLWEIREHDRALAAFPDEDDACAYADGLACAREGARIYVNGRFSPAASSPRAAPTHRTARR